MAMSHVGYARAAHATHEADDDRSVLTWHDKRNSQYGLQTPDVASSHEQSQTPMLRGTAAELRRRMGTDAQEAPVFRRPNLRGAIGRQPSLAEPVQEADWSATADATPADASHAEQVEPATAQSSPAPSGVTIKQVMDEINRQYDLDVQEAEHVEWLVSSGMFANYWYGVRCV